MDAECLTFQPLYMERIWGGRKLQTHFGRELPSKNPIGESWELVDREDLQRRAFGAEARRVRVLAFSDPGEDPGCV